MTDLRSEPALALAAAVGLVAWIDGKPIVLHLGTVAVTITAGLLVASLLSPGSQTDEATRAATPFALILGVDRPLAIHRTLLDIASHVTETTVVTSSERLVHEAEQHDASAGQDLE